VNVPLERAIAAMAGTLVDADAAPATLRIQTDTRLLVPGDAFVALHGDRFDGHDFVADAARAGAAMLVVDHSDARVSGVPTILVADTKAAYMAVAGVARRLFEGRIIAITGSAGKTTTKTFLAQLLAVDYGTRVLATPANENNEIGVSKLLLNLSNEAHDVAVVEMGARHYGDIATLVEIAMPHAGILTNIGEAHLEIMGSRERLEATKWAIFGAGARAILNAADVASRSRASSLPETPHWFAAELPPEVPFTERFTAFDGDRRVVHRDGDRTVAYETAVRVAGAHNRANLAAAVAGALELGVRLESLLSAIPQVALPEGRYDRIAAAGGVQLIYDAYNANASGMIAALDAFAAERATRRIAVLASMAELGAESRALHERVGAHAAGRVDVLLVRGEYATELARGAELGGLASRQIVFVETNARAASWLREHARADDVVLLKGSRKYKLEEIVEELRA
jgi:UDP-N-acetylmuramoyl-tripeptide--D-alanyl-D-alanine ligase